MRYLNSIFLIIITIITLTFIHCDKEDEGTRVKVNVWKTNTSIAYTSGAEVSLYTTKLAMDLNDPYLTKTSNSDGNCTFRDVNAQKYYVKAKGTVGSKEYTGDTIVTAVADKETTIDLILMESPGDLEVFVRKDQPTGEYMGATVKIFLTEQDRLFDNSFKTAVSPGGSTNGAMFYVLEPQTYYVKAEFDYSGSSYSGVDEIFVPRGTTTKLHVTCVK